MRALCRPCARRRGILVALVAGAAAALTTQAGAQGLPAEPREDPLELPGVPSLPPAPAVPPPPLPDPVAVEQPPPPPFDPLALGRVRLGVGYRASFLTDDEFDRFDTSGLLSQLSLDVTYAIARYDRWAFAAGGAWDFGSRSGITDGFDLSLVVNRLTVPLEARFYVVEGQVYLFGRVAPGAALYNLSVTNPEAPLEATPWAFAIDGSGGLSVLLFPRGALDRKVARVWLTPEVGYGWASERDLVLDSRREPVLADAPASLGSLGVRGVFVRAQLALTF